MRHEYDIDLLGMPGKLYMRVLMRLVGATEEILLEKYPEKDELLATVMDLQKAYERINRKGLWDSLWIYGVKEHLLEGIQSCRNTVSSAHVNGELNESFSIGIFVR